MHVCTYYVVMYVWLFEGIYIYVSMHVGNKVCVYESYLMHVYKDNASIV